MVWLFRRTIRRMQKENREVLERFGDVMEQPERVPVVTTQIPIYNEFNVVERVMRAAAAMKYPSGRHQIQVLDDSNDETCELIDRVADELRATGVDIEVVRRPDRVGYKAGALEYGLKTARGEVVAIFDSDFVPGDDFLLNVAPFFVEMPEVGIVQARWGHLNRKTSLLTRAQSLGIDGHFMVEQSARTFNGLFMNFNGTAGVWRRAAIDEAGGWQHDTLTEDMDLSYRSQLAGWKTHFLPDVVVPAEIPETVEAFKSQQFRWAKGSIQTAKKILPRLWASKATRFQKLEAFLHLTHYMVHPLMLLLSLLALPTLLLAPISPGFFTGIAIIIGLMLLSVAAPNVLYITSQVTMYRDWFKRLAILPALMFVGVGIAISNSRAVLEALIGVESGFIRTPKKGDKETKKYRVKMPVLPVLEILMGMYCAISLGYFFDVQRWVIGPFLGIYAAGFLFIGLLGIVQYLGALRGRTIA
jgi:cellulose synthase/poly-beta-1,6-N-acetylglucosamine synthase-like glycosyltransferase